MAKLTVHNLVPGKLYTLYGLKTPQWERRYPGWHINGYLMPETPFMFLEAETAGWPMMTVRLLVGDSHKQIRVDGLRHCFMEAK